jgi:hypothetical protein
MLETLVNIKCYYLIHHVIIRSDIYVIKLNLQKKSFDDNFSVMIKLSSHNIVVHKRDQTPLSTIKSKHSGGSIPSFHAVLDIKIPTP